MLGTMNILRNRAHPAGATFFSAGAGLLLMAWLMVPVGTTPAACELTLEPAQVEAGTPSAEVQAIASEEIGEVDGVRADRASGLQVSLLGGLPYSLEVNAADAVAGDWEVSLLQGDAAVCSGTLTVTAPGR
jgi:hypothetical protein